MQKPIQLPYLVAMLLVVLLIAPFGLFYFPHTQIDGFFGIFSLVWGLRISDYGPMYFGFHEIPMGWGFVAFLSVFRFPFAYIVLRYWKGLASKRTFYSMGAVSLLPILVYPVWYSYMTGVPYAPFIPIPFLLIIGIVLRSFMVPEPKKIEIQRESPN